MYGTFQILKLNIEKKKKGNWHYKHEHMKHHIKKLMIPC